MSNLWREAWRDMRIGIDVHVLNGPPQGTASVWLNLLPELPSTHEYRLYSFDPRVTARLFPQAHFTHARIPLRSPYLRIPVVYPWLARRDDCDVFHVNYFGPWFGVPGVVVTIHDLIYIDFPQYAPAARRLQFATLGLLTARAAREITTVSQYSKGRIIERFGVSGEGITVVPNAIGRAWLQPDRAAVGAAWARLGPRLPERFVLTVGRLEPRKSFPQAARVARALRSLGLVDGLVVVGPEDFGGPAIRREWVSDGTLDLVTHLCALDVVELQALYSHARCLLLLSLAEGFGIPILEAMAMGTPVVASNRTAFPEVCGDAARLVDPADEEEVVAATRNVLTDEALRVGLAERGKARAQLHNGERSAKQLVTVYERAATSSERP